MKVDLKDDSKLVQILEYLDNLKKSLEHKG